MVSCSSIRFTTMRSYKGRIFMFPSSIVELPSSVHDSLGRTWDVSEPCYRVVPQGAVAGPDFCPIDVFQEADKHPAGALICATVKVQPCHLRETYYPLSCS